MGEKGEKSAIKTKDIKFMEPQGAKCQAEPILHLAELQILIPIVRWINI